MKPVRVMCGWRDSGQPSAVSKTELVVDRLNWVEGKIDIEATSFPG